MLLIQTKELGAGFKMQIKYGKRTTYALQLRGHHIKSFWSEATLRRWLADMNINLDQE
jgi:hypothetical protein